MADNPHPPFELQSRRLGALPIVDLFLQRAGVERVLSRYLPPADRRVALAAAAAIGLLVRNLCVAREPLDGLAEWAERFEPGLLGLGAGESELLNDDRVGRALDQLFDCDPVPAAAGTNTVERRVGRVVARARQEAFTS